MRNRVLGVVSRLKLSALAALFVGTQLVVPIALGGVARAASESASLQQCRNGTISSPATCTDLGGSEGWVTGNAGASDSHWREGDSLPYRALLGNITPGAHSIIIQYDTTKSGQHALDYLTTYNQTEATADPCSNVAGCGSPNTYPIPNDTNATITKIPGNFTLYNGVITGTSLYTLSGTYAGDSSTSITVNFTTTAANTTPVLAWAGHIASQVGWGVGNSASAISGSPYHTYINSLDSGSVGNQDRSLDAGAVFPTPTITSQVSSANVIVGSGVSDTATLTGVKANTPLSGSVVFYVCGPSATNPDCTSGGTQVGTTAVAVTPGTGYVGSATSVNYQPSVAGDYCFRAEFTPDALSPYSPQAETNLTTECFNASIPPSTITIIKTAVPTSTQAFNYTTTGGLSTGTTGFSLTDSGVGTTNTQTFNNVGPGVYTVSESATSGWDFENLNCGNASNVVINGTTATITITGGQSDVCTYTNNERGTITVNKVTNPAGDPTLFSINASSSTGGTIQESNPQSISTSSPVVYHVSQGTYAISEDLTNTPGWSKDDSACASVVVSSTNLNPTCTIYNTKLATLNIAKVTNPTSSTQPFGFSATGPSITQANGSFILDTNNSDNTYPNNYQYTNLTPGTYTITENEASNWQLTSLNCSGVTTYSRPGDATTLSITIPAGSTPTCTFTNTELASIAGIKYAVNADGSTVAPLSGWTINLSSGSLHFTTTTASDGSYTFNGLLPSSYLLSEVQQTGWTQIYSPPTVNLFAGNYSTGNNFGNFQNASISGYKFDDLNGNGVWDGGEPGLSGWTVTLYNNGGSGAVLDNVVATDVTGSNGSYSFTNLVPDNYKLCETPQTGWVQTFPTTNAGCQLVTVALSGHNYSSTNFGNQGRGTISVVKNVDTNGDGTVDQTDVTNWNWNINGSGSYSTGSANLQSVAAGSYTVSEVQKTNYHVTSSSCSGVTAPSQPTTSLSANVTPGENEVCTFTNTRDTGALSLIKHVENNYGGTAVAANFNLHVLQNGVDVSGSPAAGSETGTNYTLETGTYTVSEDNSVPGYQQLSIVCNGVTTNVVVVSATSPSTCTITNADIAPQLTVIKNVVNQYSGVSIPSDFTMNVNATNVSPSASFPGSSSGTTVTLNVGSYSVTEGPHDGYNVSYSAGCSGTITLGQTDVCTVTNNDIAHPNIKVVKSGPAYAHEGDQVMYSYAVTNTGDAALSGITVVDNLAGNAVYQSGDVNTNNVLDVGETWIYTAAYTIPIGQISDVVNTVQACGTDADQIQVCATDTHTLVVIHPSISVVKSGPTYGYEGQFIGYTYVVTNTGDTTLSDVHIVDNLAQPSFCSSSVLAPKDTTTCTASYIIPTPTIGDVINTVTSYGTDLLNETVTAQDQHTLQVIHPNIKVVKSGPAYAHEGDQVTYSYTVTNTGDIPLSNVTVNDNLAGSATYQSGDTNSNQMLDLNETWIYTAIYTIPTPTTGDVTNIVTACGTDPIQIAEEEDGTPVCGTDTHTLRVIHPSIHVVKTASRDSALPGDSVVYTFSVTNTGDTSLGDLTVLDNVVGSATYQSGDTNNNQMLDLNETWVFKSVNYIVPSTLVGGGDVTNTVKACGNDALQLNVCSTGQHTLVVNPVPVLVNTGTKILSIQYILPVILIVGAGAIRRFSRSSAK